MEQWKIIVGYPDYQVSDMGRVKSTKKGERILKPFIDRYGYCWVSFSGDSKKVNARITSLVADAWIGPLPDGLERAHDNGDSTDNRVVNIRYKTPTENNRDRIRHGTIPKGEIASNAALKAEQVKQIFTSSEPDSILSLKYGVSRYAIWAVKTGKNWRHITDSLQRSAAPTRRAKWGEFMGK